MNINYFNVVRVFPPLKGIYDWNSMSSEFLPMKGYDLWKAFRDEEDIKETLEVYIITDLNSNDVTSRREKLTSEIRSYLDMLLRSAEEDYNNSFKDLLSWKKWQTAKVEAINLANQKFTTILQDEYIKL